MADDGQARAQVSLWGDHVGTVLEHESGSIFFTYTEEYEKNGHSISPIYLGFDRDYPVSFDNLRGRPGEESAFMGLPGVLADALPDAFGRKAVRQYFERQGEPDKALSPVQQLLYVGKRGIGALEFHPPEQPEMREVEQEILELKKLALDAKKIVNDDPDVAIPEIYEMGSSAGGRRPKAIVNYDRDDDNIRSGRTEPKGSETPAILKFDGAEPDRSATELSEPQHYNRIEHAYNKMARDVEMTMPEIQALEDDGYYHLLIPRFDIREEGTRLHQHTLGGLLHIDYNNPGAGSYEDYLQAILDLGMDYSDLREGYRRMIFNILAVNQDDHVKNLSFHMDRNGDWSLAPAYDLTFAYGSGATRKHQMTVQGKQENIEMEDCLEVAREYGIRNPKGMIDDVRSTLDSWPEYARETRVPQEKINRIDDHIRQRDQSFVGE
jgi:serine/threonine-protein kinase HipA